MTLVGEPESILRVVDSSAAGATAPADLEVMNELEVLATPPPSEFITTNGIKFKLKKVPSMLATEASRRAVIPRPPVVFIEAKGRSEENPDDPDYKEALRDAQIQQGILGVNTYLSFGTEVVSLPEGIIDWTEPEWSEDITDVTGVVIPVKGKARYCAWLKFYALSDEDFTGLNLAIARHSGYVPEADVTAAEDEFRGDTERDADTGLSDT